MTRMTGPDCVVMCNFINTYIHTYIHTWEDQCEWHRMTRMTGPDCAVMCNLINMHTYNTWGIAFSSFILFFTCIGIAIYVVYFVCDSASEFGAMGSTSFFGVFPTLTCFLFF